MFTLSILTTPRLLALLVVVGLLIILLLWALVDELRKGRKVNIRPVLDVIQQQNKRWSVRNVGKGVALEVTVGHKLSGKFQSPERIPALYPGQSFDLHWYSGQETGMAINYRDLENGKYSSVYQNGKLKYRAGKYKRVSGTLSTKHNMELQNATKLKLSEPSEVPLRITSSLEDQ